MGAKPSDGKKPLSNIAEKIIQKSKMKKIKTKKAVVKKAKPLTTAAASTEDTIDSEEKENVGSSRRPSDSNDPSIKMDDVKTSSTRKRPLEDIDVEDKMSQGQGKLRASNEARGLSSSTNDVEMMVNHAEKDQPMDAPNATGKTFFIYTTINNRKLYCSYCI